LSKRHPFLGYVSCCRWSSWPFWLRYGPKWVRSRHW